MLNKVTNVACDSIAMRAGIREGDLLAAVNGEEITDVFDYRMALAAERVILEMRRGDETIVVELVKGEYDEIGLEFELGLMDAPRACRNKCIFCFIDQLPDRMRDTLYFKDDDVRLSFLQGNYVTLTNISDTELDRLISYRLSPINISVHTVDQTLRERMLNNKNAGKLMEQIDRMAAAGIKLNCQIVLCKGVNDGSYLDDSISRLAEYIPSIESLSVVPVGISGHRDGLYKLDPFTKHDARLIISQIDYRRALLKERTGMSFVYAADEFYVLAGQPIPRHSYYDNFPQIENGVGMLALFRREFAKEMKRLTPDDKHRSVAVVTGEAAKGYIKKFSQKLTEAFVNTEIYVCTVKNNFFGGRTTVAGLLAGADIIRAVKPLNLCAGTRVLLPMNLLRSGEQTLLDGKTISDIESALGLPVTAVEVNGRELIRAVLY